MSRFVIKNPTGMVVFQGGKQSYGPCSRIEIFGNDKTKVSDSCHTFEELYDHRVELFIALCRYASDTTFVDESDGVWRSKKHHDGSGYDGWFIMGIGREPGSQITYHLPLSRWEDCDFAETLELAPEWDNHTPADVLERLREL